MSESNIAQLLAGADLPDSPSPRLDAEWLLADALGKPASYLRAWPERTVPAPIEARYRSMLARRREGEPVAYILGRQGFWSLDLEVAPQTLIPRPDTESLVEAVLELHAHEPIDALDLGTGTGAIALALASERPMWRVLGVDRIAEAVELAERNGVRLGLRNCRFQRSDWFGDLAGQRFDLIVGNPPYICADDPHLMQGDVRFEPQSALVAGSDGLADLRLICAQAPAHLRPDGWLVLEHGFDQAEFVRQLLEAAGLHAVHSRTDLAGHWRVSLGQAR